MPITHTSLEPAANHHKGLPHRIREYLNKRGIPDVLIGPKSLPTLDRKTLSVFNVEFIFS